MAKLLGVVFFLGLSMLCASPIAAQTSEQPQLIIEGVQLLGVRLGRRGNIRRRLPFSAGDTLNESLIESARLRLLGTGIFERIETRLERGSVRGKVIIVFDCLERPTSSVDRIHLGHARPSQLWSGIEVSDIDPFGNDLSVGLGFVSSGDQTSVKLTLGTPYNHPTLPVSVIGRLRHVNGNEPFVGPLSQQIGGETVDYIGVPYVRTGGELEVRLGIATNTRLMITSRVEYIDASLPKDASQINADGEHVPFEFLAPDQATLLGALELALEFDTRNDPAFATRGLRASVHVRTAFAESPYGTIMGGFEQYVPMPFGHVLRIDARAGLVFGDAPFFDRFFIGDVHPYIPARALGLNFAQRRGPNLIEGAISDQRYEAFAGRTGFEYRVPLGGGPKVEKYWAEFFVGGALVSLGSPGEPLRGDGLPADLALDVGLRLQSELGVMGLSVSSLFLLLDP